MPNTRFTCCAKVIDVRRYTHIADGFYTEAPFAAQKPYVKPQIPMIYNLMSDPHEDQNPFYTEITIDWVFAPVARIIGEYEESVKKYPNIKVGEEGFKGYQQ